VSGNKNDTKFFRGALNWWRGRVKPWGSTHVDQRRKVYYFKKAVVEMWKVIVLEVEGKKRRDNERKNLEVLFKS